MLSPGNGAARGMAKPLKVLLPSSMHRQLRIPDELARQLGGRMALVVSPFGKVWRVEVGRDGEGAFLGRGWPEFAAVHGVGAKWFLLFRHEGGAVLTVKVFDASNCCKEFARPRTVAATRCSIGGKRRPQFIKVHERGLKEKMLIPPEFVKHISEELQNSWTALVFCPLGKFCRVELKKGPSDVFFAGGWPQFLAFHGITENDSLLLRYEGNMVFTVKAFGLNGCQKGFRELDVKTEQVLSETESQDEESSCRNEGPRAERKKRAKIGICGAYYGHENGRPSWIKRVVNNCHRLFLPQAFCNAIGFRGNCRITLKASMNSSQSWQVRGLVYDRGHYLGHGWRSFCIENKVIVGDVCTFNVVETTLWHVVITRC